MKKTAFIGILIAMAIVIGYVERFIPLGLVIPLPGVKIGLANIITLFALFQLGWKTALTVTILRSTMTSILIGSMTALIFSLTGGLLALLVMSVLKKRYNRTFSLIGISIAGAAAHNTGQMLAAALVLQTTEILIYLSFLLMVSMVTGFVTAAAASAFFVQMDKIPIYRSFMATMNEKQAETMAASIKRRK